MSASTDTIFALATPPGKSAIAVIRISGVLASGVSGKFGVKTPDVGSIAVVKLRDDKGAIIDQVVSLFMAGPRSSTGEDVLELHCHGSRAVITRILTYLSRQNGLRPAEPGEFTHRAFHNDKMDLSGAEGLADLIDAETEFQLTQAWNQMDGALRQPVLAWRSSLIKISGQLEALIDFSDENLPASVEYNLREETEALLEVLHHHLDDGHFGELIREGVTVALVGPVNAGKSTLLNRLAGRDAAIVSDEAGTTRDVVSVKLNLGGIPVTIMDTAGIRDDVGKVEAEGIRRAIEAAQQAQISIVVVDGSIPDWADRLGPIKEVVSGKAIILLNKSDQGTVGKIPADAMPVSLATGEGVDEAVARLTDLLIPENIAGRSPLITRARHRTAMETAANALESALQQDFNAVPEIAAEDFRRAAMALGRITGIIDVEELLGSIFSSFCIGK